MLATLLKKRLQRKYFPMNIAKLLRTPFFIEHLEWLLLQVLSLMLVSHIELEIKSR